MRRDPSLFLGSRMNTPKKYDRDKRNSSKDSRVRFSHNDVWNIFAANGSLRSSILSTSYSEKGNFERATACSYFSACFWRVSPEKNRCHFFQFFYVFIYFYMFFYVFICFYTMMWWTIDSSPKLMNRSVSFHWISSSTFYFCIFCTANFVDETRIENVENCCLYLFIDLTHFLSIYLFCIDSLEL